MIAQFPLVHDRFCDVSKIFFRSHNVQHWETLRPVNKKLFCSEISRSISYDSALFIFLYTQKLSQQVKHCGHTTFAPNQVWPPRRRALRSSLTSCLSGTLINHTNTWIQRWRLRNQNRPRVATLVSVGHLCVFSRFWTFTASGPPRQPRTRGEQLDPVSQSPRWCNSF